jgi:hypothetical protein
LRKSFHSLQIFYRMRAALRFTASSASNLSLLVHPRACPTALTASGARRGAFGAIGLAQLAWRLTNAGQFRTASND